MILLKVCLKASSFFLLIVALIANQSSHAHSERALEIQRKMNLRQSISYSRIYSICSAQFPIESFAYVKAAFKQVYQLSAFEKKQINHLRQNGSGLSPELYLDLNSDALFLAAEDCGLNSEQRDKMVRSLLLADLTGKTIAAGSLVLFLKASQGILNKIKAHSAVSHYTVSGSIIALTTYTIFEYFEKKLAKPADEQKVKENELALHQVKKEVDLKFNTNTDAQTAKHLRSQVLAMLSADRDYLSNLIAIETDGLILRELNHKIIYIESKIMTLQKIEEARTHVQ